MPLLPDPLDCDLRRPCRARRTVRRRSASRRPGSRTSQLRSPPQRVQARVSIRPGNRAESPIRRRAGSTEADRTVVSRSRTESEAPSPCLTSPPPPGRCRRVLAGRQELPGDGPPTTAGSRRRPGCETTRGRRASQTLDGPTALVPDPRPSFSKGTAFRSLASSTGLLDETISTSTPSWAPSPRSPSGFGVCDGPANLALFVRSGRVAEDIRMGRRAGGDVEGPPPTVHDPAALQLLDVAVDLLDRVAPHERRRPGDRPVAHGAIQVHDAKGREAGSTTSPTAPR